MRTFLLIIAILSSASMAQALDVYIPQSRDITVMTPPGNATFYQMNPGIGNTFNIYNYETGDRTWYEVPQVQPSTTPNPLDYLGTNNPYLHNSYDTNDYDWRYDDGSLR